MVEYQEKLLFCLQCHTQGLICIGKWIAVKEIPNVQQTPDCLPHFLGMSYQTTSSFKIIVHDLSHTKKGETDNILKECDVFFRLALHKHSVVELGLCIVRKLDVLLKPVVSAQL